MKKKKEKIFLFIDFTLWEWECKKCWRKMERKHRARETHFLSMCLLMLRQR